MRPNTQLETTILSKIAVTAPYFALQDLKFLDDKKTVVAGFPVEQKNIYEATPITAAESSRHLAILGSVACAYARESINKAYFLAFNAKFRCQQEQFDTYMSSDPLLGKAEVVEISKRTATVNTALYVSDSMLFTAQINYVILTENLFQRMNEKHYVAEVGAGTNPYSSLVPLQNVHVDNAVLSAETIPVAIEHTLGHFDHYPSMPVAILMTYFSLATNELINHLVGGYKKVVVISADMDVKKLVFITQKVDIKVEFLSKRGNVFQFVWYGHVSGSLVAKVDVEYLIVGDVALVEVG
jgi:3-hydroxymyristoyl/3-hydroxydecanoyl-(acyl carrier protein) dehydratase